MLLPSQKPGRKLTIRDKIHRKGVCDPETKQSQGGKRNIAFCDTIPTLSVYYKRSSNEKKSSMRSEVVGPLPYSGLTIWFFADVSIFGDLDLGISGL